jgi:phage shock protein PspC (stress-responsive transcriptional regulator)
MQRSQPSLFTRHDTFFGVCEALGQDFGFNANYLRIALAVALLLDPMVTVASYCGLGVVVAVSRWLFPSRAADAAPAADQPAAMLAGDNDAEAIELPKAA